METTIANLAGSLADALADSHLENAKWLVPWRLTSRPKARIFCFSYAGTGASVFRSWPAALPSCIDVVAIQLPGREGRFRERCVTSIEEITSFVSRSVQPHLDVPFIVFGHSLGALLAFELTLALREMGARLPSRLIASGMRAPQLAPTVPPFSYLPDDLFVAEVQRRYGALQREFLEQPEALRMFLPVLRSDLCLFEAYRCRNESPLDLDISALCGEQDEWSQPNLLQGWQIHTTRQLRLRVYSGTHLFIHSASEQILQDLAQEIMTG